MMESPQPAEWSPDRSPPPATLREAREADGFSRTVRAALEAAAVRAGPAGGEGAGRSAIGIGALIAGMVAVGQHERGGPLVAGAMVDALEALVGPGRIREGIGAAGAHSASGADEGLAFSPRAREAFLLARHLALMTLGRDRIDARHLIAALLAPLPADGPVRPGYGAVLRRIWQRDWGIDPSALCAPVLAAIERNPEEREDLAAWRDLLAVPALAPAAFAADAPAPNDDALGRRADARRLAELACLADNAPPLAVGLFGDWGSGKSTFMAMMQDEVERIGAAWRGEAASPFATRVAQIRFNAWSFADANLWASLAVEIFEGLRDEIARLEGTGGAVSRRAATLLAEISARTEAAATARDAAERAVAEARKALAALDEKLRALDARLEGGHAAARMGALLAGRQEDITGLLRDLGVLGPSEAATAERLAAEAGALAAAGKGGFAVARRVMRLASRRWLLTLAVAAALAAALVHSGFGGGGSAALAFLLPFAARVAAAVNRLSPLLDAVEAEEKAEADFRRERAALAEAREAAAKALAEREAAAARALSGVEAIGEAAATPQAMLRFFLNESDELRGYQREIGLVGRLRRSFQRLDDLMAAQADPAKATRADLPALDRIILYIDDLDRLRESQVVQVLEAVGLLLQFRLFVVVVAVDARWLEGALRSFYGGQLGGAGQAAPGDYLEKIFQVPFWLPRLEPGGAAFEGLARLLLPEGEEAEMAPPPDLPHAPGGMTEGEYVIDPDEAPRAGDEAPAERRAAEVRRLTLTGQEAEVLGALMPLAATGPRGAKRFVNLYRLARAGRSGEELARFLGEGGSEAAFPALAYALALSSACSPAQWGEVERFYAREAGHGRAEGVEKVLAWMEWEARAEAEGEGGLPGDWPSTVWRWLAGLRRVPPPLARMRHGDVGAMCGEARRYSFHPPGPGLDRAAAPDNPAPSEAGGPA